MNTRVPSEPRYDLRKRSHSQQQQDTIFLLIHKFEKLTIHELNEEDLSICDNQIEENYYKERSS